MWKLAEDTISRDEVQALAEWLLTFPRLTQGEQVRRFEEAWAAWLGCEHAIMVGSGTTANFALVAGAAARAGRDRPRVGVSAVTWSTNVTPSLILGHEVVVFDIDRRTLGVDSAGVCEAMETGGIDVLFVTHLLGLNALDDAIVETARRCGVILLEDCCESHGARHGGQKIGTAGLGSTFSFYYGHHMSTVEGGVVCTDDAELADRVRLMRAHGLARESRRFDEYARRHPDIDPQFLFVSTGLNFRSTELNAFLGLGQLERLDSRIEIRNRNMRRYLDAAPDWVWRDFRTAGMSSFALPLIATDDAAATRVRHVVDRLNIERRPVVAGNLLVQPFMQGRRIRVHGNGTPVADHVHARGIYVGNGHHVTEAMVDRLTAELAEEGNRAP